jgi:hypothetical protein
MEMLEEHLCINGNREEILALEHDENRPYLNFINFPRLQVYKIFLSSSLSLRSALSRSLRSDGFVACYRTS